MITLEEVLQKDFNCKRPFYKNPKKNADGSREYLTKAGSKAYSQLTEMLYNIGAITETDMNEVVERLDQIVNEEY